MTVKKSSRPTVSIVIPSRGRAHLVPQLLNAIRLLTYPSFEVILVGEHPDIRPYRLSESMRTAIHYFPCFEPNISAARNIGIRAARGEIVAFIDDDAVPETDWLDRLTEPFADDRVGMVGGRVRDRDGVRFQFSGTRFDRLGHESLLECDRQTVQVFPPATDSPVGLMGTNCAFRRGALMAIGGFDQSFVYYLDETDVILRMNAAGWSTAWVPQAEVHHKSSQNEIRGTNREPRDPFQLAASKAYFCKRHGKADEVPGALDICLRKCRADYDHHLRLGRISRDDIIYLEDRLAAGFAEGSTRRPRLPLIANDTERVIIPFGERLSRRSLSLALEAEPGLQGSLSMIRLAQALSERGHRVSVMLADLSSPNRGVELVDRVWHHHGTGTGLSVGQRLSGLARSFWGDRLAPEVARMIPRRQFDAVIRPRHLGSLMRSDLSRDLYLPAHHLRLRMIALNPDCPNADRLKSRIEAELAASLGTSATGQEWSPDVPSSHENTVTLSPR